MATLLGTTRGSNLNLRWSKCGVWLVDQWVPISLWASVCLTFDCTLRTLNVIGCMVGYCVHLGHWHADYADWLSWLRILMYRFFCASLLYPLGTLTCWLCYLAYLSIVTLILPWYFCSPYMYRLTCCISFDLMCWFSCSYIILIIFEHAVFVPIHLDCHNLYVDMSDIFVLCLTVCCMIAFLCVIACRLSVWAVYLSLYLQPSGFGHLFHYGSYFCKCEALCVFVSLTELEVRSRV